VFEELLGKYAQSKIQGAFATAKVDKEEFYPEFVVDYPEVGGRLKALRDHLPVVNEPPQPPAFSNAGDTGNKKADAKKAEDSVAAPLKIDWRTLGVGLGGGSLVGFLMAWRLRDLLRRGGGARRA